MKAITLTQPWATLVAIGAKRIETRGWRTNYRGPLAIHAAKGFPAEARDLCRHNPFHACLYHAGFATESYSDALPRGFVVAVCDLVDVLPTEHRGVCDSVIFEEYPELDTPQERAFGNYAPGRYGFVLENVRRLPDPIPVKGALGLWNWDDIEAGTR